MEFLELATSRFSVRDFAAWPVEQEKIEKILQAAKGAPTAVNYQPQMRTLRTAAFQITVQRHARHADVLQDIQRALICGYTTAL